MTILTIAIMACRHSIRVGENCPTWQLENWGFVLVGEALGQVQVCIASVLHHIGTVQVPMGEAYVCPGCVQVPKHLHQCITEK